VSAQRTGRFGKYWKITQNPIAVNSSDRDSSYVHGAIVVR
jgi:hypothetical protein